MPRRKDALTLYIEPAIAKAMQRAAEEDEVELFVWIRSLVIEELKRRGAIKYSDLIADLVNGSNGYIRDLLDHSDPRRTAGRIEEAARQSK